MGVKSFWVVSDGQSVRWVAEGRLPLQMRGYKAPKAVNSYDKESVMRRVVLLPVSQVYFDGANRGNCQLFGLMGVW